MHEMAIAQGILDIAVQEATLNGAETITRIKLRIGEMTGVQPEALTFCFEALAAETPAEAAILEIELVPLTAECQSCGQQFGVERYRFCCPSCSSGSVKTLSGRELQVEHLEVE
ncbi:hydrogenase maturation nickel metallochaperone HypA [Anaerospora sp.]|jgi:hydrogenase nickel incorporation protein HypA/HybF|uniref:hydrogenase maturation nickel metallochaperone HypA n=1 Tax=Anaerospora sp. TaxID=1960278 RepID=UPI00289AD126|nr:hydrogenase maturation nickel metallochaperone HypA [Anaerospora sp.]